MGVAGDHPLLKLTCVQVLAILDSNQVVPRRLASDTKEHDFGTVIPVYYWEEGEDEHWRLVTSYGRALLLTVDLDQRAVWRLAGRKIRAGFRVWKSSPR